MPFLLVVVVRGKDREWFLNVRELGLHISGERYRSLPFTRALCESECNKRALNLNSPIFFHSPRRYQQPCLLILFFRGVESTELMKTKINRQHSVRYLHFGLRRSARVERLTFSRIHRHCCVPRINETGPPRGTFLKAKYKNNFSSKLEHLEIANNEVWK